MALKEYLKRIQEEREEKSKLKEQFRQQKRMDKLAEYEKKLALKSEQKRQKWLLKEKAKIDKIFDKKKEPKYKRRERLTRFKLKKLKEFQRKKWERPKEFLKAELMLQEQQRRKPVFDLRQPPIQRFSAEIETHPDILRLKEANKRLVDRQRITSPRFKEQLRKRREELLRQLRRRTNILQAGKYGSQEFNMFSQENQQANNLFKNSADYSITKERSNSINILRAPNYMRYRADSINIMDTPNIWGRRF